MIKDIIIHIIWTLIHTKTCRLPVAPPPHCRWNGSAMARIDTKIDCHSFCVTGITEYGTRRKGWLALTILASTC